MSKKKLPIEQTKIKINVTINRELNDKLNDLSNNKSKLIETILLKYIDKWNK
jgi:post-segregation antitoxin (ccd killing protein)